MMLKFITEPVIIPGIMRTWAEPDTQRILEWRVIAQSTVTFVKFKRYLSAIARVEHMCTCYERQKIQCDTKSQPTDNPAQTRCQ